MIWFVIGSLSFLCGFAVGIAANLTISIQAAEAEEENTRQFPRAGTRLAIMDDLNEEHEREKSMGPGGG